jgi:hypothetical protein
MLDAFASTDVEFGSIKDATPGRIDAELMQRRDIEAYVVGVGCVYSC